MDKSNWNSTQGMEINGKEGPKEELEGFKPSEKLSYILSVLEASCW